MAKGKKRIIVALCVALSLSAIAIFVSSHQTFITFNDWWIMGRTLDEVEERYGEAEEFWPGALYGYYIGVNNSGPMPSHLPEYYMMEIEDGIITHVFKGRRPGD